MRGTKKVFWLAGMGLTFWWLIQYGIAVQTFRVVERGMTYQMEQLIDQIHQAVSR